MVYGHDGLYYFIALVILHWIICSI